jgi:glycerol kinase
MAFQSRDLLEAMLADAGLPLSVLKVDGGASVNDGLMQFQADILDATVRRPVVAETTALGAAYLAGLAVGYWTDLADIAGNWALDREFIPAMPYAERESRCRIWNEAVRRTLGWLEASRRVHESAADEMHRVESPLGQGALRSAYAPYFSPFSNPASSNS